MQTWIWLSQGKKFLLKFLQKQEAEHAMQGHWGSTEVSQGK